MKSKEALKVCIKPNKNISKFPAFERIWLEDNGNPLDTRIKRFEQGREKAIVGKKGNNEYKPKLLKFKRKLINTAKALTNKNHSLRTNSLKPLIILDCSISVITCPASNQKSLIHATLIKLAKTTIQRIHPSKKSQC